MCGGRAAAAAAAVAAAAPPWQGAGVHRQRAPQVAHTSDYTIKHFELVSPQGRGLDGPGGGESHEAPGTFWTYLAEATALKWK